MVRRAEGQKNTYKQVSLNKKAIHYGAGSSVKGFSCLVRVCCPHASLNTRILRQHSSNIIYIPQSDLAVKDNKGV